VADSLGNLHHYFVENFGNALSFYSLYYLRTDIYGHVLTDTVKLNGFAGPWALTIYTNVMGDGAHSWCSFGEYTHWQQNPYGDRSRGLFLTERDINGQEVFAPRLVGPDGGYEGPPSWDMASALRVQDSTIHTVGNILPFYYYRYTTRGESLIWRRPIDGLLISGVDPSIHISSDGVPWAAMRHDNGRSVLLVRFGSDTSQATYLPFTGPPGLWYAWNFGIDQDHNFHFLAGNANVDGAYYRLDSSLAVTDSLSLAPSWVAFGTIKVDNAGNCLLIWDKDPGLSWAYRRADGTWTVPPTVIDPGKSGSNISIVVMDSTHFAFTCQGRPRTQEYMQFCLYTYGFPPDVAASPRMLPSAATLTAYPNPFSSTLQLNLPNESSQAVVIYDILGREVWSSPLSAGMRTVTLNDPHLANLPSGTYYLSVTGTSPAAPIEIHHIK
jgi:hypothetical protein